MIVMKDLNIYITFISRRCEGNSFKFWEEKNSYKLVLFFPPFYIKFYFFFLNNSPSFSSDSFVKSIDLWGRLMLPPPAWSWHVYISAATHTHSQSHVKVWKWLCVITEQPKPCRGSTTDPTLRQQTQSVRLWRGLCVWGEGCCSVCGNVCECLGYGSMSVLYLLLRVCVPAAHMAVCPAQPLWPSLNCWLSHSNLPKSFTPQINK